MQGVQVQSLVGELRSHMPWGTEKKKETGLEKKEKGLKKKKKKILWKHRQRLRVAFWSRHVGGGGAPLSRRKQDNQKQEEITITEKRTDMHQHSVMPTWNCQLLS